MTDRDEFAKAAMQGLISSDAGLSKLRKATDILIAEGEHVEGVEVIAMVSYELADAMLRYGCKTDAKTVKSKPRRGGVVVVENDDLKRIEQDMAKGW
jgi:hypothetical protein